MHDPSVVIGELKVPRLRRDPHGYRRYHYLLTLWHIEPGGRDAGEVCRWSAMKRHPRHWRLQVHPLQKLRRSLLTRCAWCGGRDRKGDRVNISQSWNGERTPWWRGEKGLYHADCSSIQRAHQTCTCVDGIYPHGDERVGGWGRCLKCGLFRAHPSTDPDHQSTTETTTAMFKAIPVGQRDPEVTALATALWTAQRLRERKATHVG